MICDFKKFKYKAIYFYNHEIRYYCIDDTLNKNMQFLEKFRNS